MSYNSLVKSDLFSTVFLFIRKLTICLYRIYKHNYLLVKNVHFSLQGILIIRSQGDTFCVSIYIHSKLNLYISVTQSEISKRMPKNRRKLL